MELQAYIVDICTRNWSLIACFVAVCLYFVKSTSKRPHKFPPGPTGLPFLGVAPLAGRRPEITFTKWGEQYGDILGLKMGNNLTVVLNSYDAIYEALVKRATVFNDRPDNYIFTNVMKKKGVSMNDYTPEYIVERKFAHSTLSRLGFGQRSLEASIIEEAEYFLNEFGDKEFELDSEAKRKLLYAAANTIAQVTIGKRYSTYQDPELQTVMGGLIDFFRTGSLAYAATVIFPWFKQIPPIRGSIAAIRRGLGQVSEVAQKQISSHEESLDESNPRDFIDEYLIERKSSDGDRMNLYSKETLDCTFRDFFGAGTETFQGAVIFSSLVLANRPEMMKRIHEEIDNVLGKDGEITYAIRAKMPLCHAFTKEILRYRTLGPFLIAHCTSKSINFRGYYIPKGTTILPNAYAVHNNPKHWDKPEEFNPDRHLDDEGKLNMSKYFMPFGVGPRLCIGRRLAEMELFIFFVTICRRYEIVPKPTSTCERPLVEEDSSFTGMTISPPESTPVMFIPRK